MIYAKVFLFLGFHVDDSEVTLNACLGEKFSGGKLYFKGVRCDKHVNTATQLDVCPSSLLFLFNLSVLLVFPYK